MSLSENSRRVHSPNSAHSQVLRGNGEPLVHSSGLDRSLLTPIRLHETLNEIRTAAALFRTPRFRTMRQFACDEIVLSTGPFPNRRFNCERQPFVGHFFDLIDSGAFIEICATGPSQTGKSVACFVIPILYHLFEMKETVICALPQMEMANDKWTLDLLPMIEKTRYRDLVPRMGKKVGATNPLIVFRNGAALRFMSGGGSDKSRSHFTSRVIAFTEIDELGTKAEKSVESDKIKQIEARARAFGSRRRVYKECTVSVEHGHIWQAVNRGTATRLALPCTCGHWFTPEREHLKGWQECETPKQAKSKTYIECPACKKKWTEKDRVAANHSAIPLHRGQEIVAGKVVGEMPDVETLGFRWNAANNLLIKTGDIGADEVKARDDENEENAEREMSQFVWAVPYEQKGIEKFHLDFNAVKRKTAPKYTKGVVPDGFDFLSTGVDMGKRLAHWTTTAWCNETGCGHVIDYGRVEVPSDAVDVDQAIEIALNEIKEMCETGWMRIGGELVSPSQVWIDAGWQKERKGQRDAIYDWVRSCGNQDKYRPTLGRGQRKGNSKYVKPAQMNQAIPFVGEEYHFKLFQTALLFVVEFNADWWKLWTHKRLGTRSGHRGSLTLFESTDKNEHVSFAKHLTAESLVEEFEPGKNGVNYKWVVKSRNNHWLDTTTLSCVAAAFCGFKVKSPAGTNSEDEGE